MDLAYAREKQIIVDKYIRLKPWYEGDLQRTVRHRYAFSITTGGYTEERPDPDPIPDRENWDGTKFWKQCFESELNKLERCYYPQQKEDPNDKKKYMWVGINPETTKYPTIQSLYDSLISLEDKTQIKYKAVVEAHTEGGYRPHIHMILFTEVRPCRIIDTFSKHFKCAKNFVDAKNMKAFYEEKLNYIKGIKIKEKKEFVEKDKKERDESNIPHLVESDEN